MPMDLRITPWQVAFVYEVYEAGLVIQHDWHCMAYAIYLLQQYHNGKL